MKSDSRRYYKDVNRCAYEDTASEFQEKISQRIAGTKEIVEIFSRFIDDRFRSPRILELGPGSGYALKLLVARGYEVTGIEFSPKMAALAKKTCPQATMITDEFIDHDFGDTTYSAILAVAFIHLFPKEDVVKVLDKVYSLLEWGGVTYISTTIHKYSEEGFFEKDNFQGRPVRFRKRFTDCELETLIHASRFKILHNYLFKDHEVEGKVWMNYIIEKS